MSLTVAEYARSFDVDVKELYSAKQSLVRKGAMPGTRVGDEEADPARAGDFVPVQIPAARAPTSNPCVCRIHHPSGLLIECAIFPPAAWLGTLLKSADVPA